MYDKNTIDEMIEVLNGHKNGEVIEFTSINSDGRWLVVRDPLFNFNEFNYRVKKIKIPWIYVDDMWKYFAMDADGDCYFYEKAPQLLESKLTWRCCSGSYISAEAFKIDKSGVDWKKALVERPLSK